LNLFFKNKKSNKNTTPSITNKNTNTNMNTNYNSIFKRRCGPLVVSLYESVKFMIIDESVNSQFLDLFITIWSDYKQIWKNKAGRPNHIPIEKNGVIQPKTVNDIIRDMNRFEEHQRNNNSNDSDNDSDDDDNESSSNGNKKKKNNNNINKDNHRKDITRQKRFHAKHNSSIYVYTELKQNVYYFSFNSSDESIKLLLLMFCDMSDIKKLGYLYQLPYKSNDDDDNNDNDEYDNVKHKADCLKMDNLLLKVSELSLKWRSSVLNIHKDIPNSIYVNLLKYNIDVQSLFSQYKENDSLMMKDNVYKFTSQVVSNVCYKDENSNIILNVKNTKTLKSSQKRKDFNINSSSSSNKTSTDDNNEDDDDLNNNFEEEINIDDLVSNSDSIVSSNDSSFDDNNNNNNNSSSAYSVNKIEYDNLMKHSILLNKMDVVKVVSTVASAKDILLYDIHSYRMSAVLFSICVNIYNEYELDQLSQIKYENGMIIKMKSEDSESKIDLSILTCYRYVKWAIENGVGGSDSNNIIDNAVDNDLINTIPSKIRLKLNEYVLQILKYIKFNMDSKNYNNDNVTVTEDELKSFEFIESLFNHFKDIDNKISLQIPDNNCDKNGDNNININRRRTLKKYRLIKTEAAIINFFDMMRETPIVSTNVIDTNYKKLASLKISSNKHYLMVFRRSDVSISDLYKSFLIIDNRFKGEDIRYQKFDDNSSSNSINSKSNWELIFSETFVTILIPVAMWLDLIKYYIPSIVDKSLTKRNLYAPMFYVSVHNYYYGGNMGLLSCMKSILKYFQYSKESSSASVSTAMSSQQHSFNQNSYVPSNSNDPIIKFYSILHLIIMRYENSDDIWTELLKPYRDISYLYTRKNEETSKDYIVGFSDLHPNIYTAIKSFIMVYASHIIKYETLVDVYNEFKVNTLLREQHQLCYILVENMMLNEREQKIYYTKYHEDKYIHINVSHLNVIDNDDDTGNKKTSYKNLFPYYSCGASPVILFFFLCASKLISNELALKVFTSISINPNLNRNRKIEAIIQHEEKYGVDVSTDKKKEAHLSNMKKKYIYNNNIINSLFRLTEKQSTKRLKHLNEMKAVLNDNADIWIQNIEYERRKQNRKMYKDKLNPDDDTEERIILVDDGNNGANVNDMSGFTYLLQCIEELSHHSINCKFDNSGQNVLYSQQRNYRGYPEKPHGFLKISASEILSGGSMQLPRIPIDVVLLPSVLQKLDISKIEKHYSKYDTENIEYLQRSYQPKIGNALTLHQDKVPSTVLPEFISPNSPEYALLSKENRVADVNKQFKYGKYPDGILNKTLTELEDESVKGGNLRKDYLLYQLNDIIMFCDNVMPVWASEICPSKFKNMKSLKNVSIKPFTEAHDLLLDCILFSPIRKIKMISNSDVTTTVSSIVNNNMKRKTIDYIIEDDNNNESLFLSPSFTKKIKI